MSTSSDDLFAAEYVLGTLDAGERQQAESMRRSQPAFDAAVTAWDLRFAPLSETGEPIAPSQGLRERILVQIADSQSASTSMATVLVLRREVRVWRTATVFAMAMAAVLGVFVAKSTWLTPAHAPQTYLAVLQQGGGAPSFIVSVDLDQRKMTVVPSATAQNTGKSYELWMIASDQAKPLSLGVMDGSSPAHPSLPQGDAAMISRATYAVTIEPLGGSPTGQPTSSPVYVGQLHSAIR